MTDKLFAFPYLQKGNYKYLSGEFMPNVFNAHQSIGNRDPNRRYTVTDANIPIELLTPSRKIGLIA